MTPTPTPTAESELTPELIERVTKLSPQSKDKLVGLLIDELDAPTEDPGIVNREWQAELARRIEAVRDGSMKTYSIDETMAYLNQSLAERIGS